jgi:hypothetical protein
MNILTYIIWAAALFFAVTWTAGLVLRPDFRLKSTIATVILWWIWVAAAACHLYSVFHLVWLMPASVFLPTAVMMNEIARSGKASVLSILLKSVLLWPVLQSLILLPFSKQIRMHEQHAELVQRLSLQEAVLAHNELTYGGFLYSVPLDLIQGDYRSASRVYRDIEVVTSLYEHIMQLKDSPITKAEKAKYRIGLTAAMGKVSRGRGSEFSERVERARELLEPFLVDRIAPETVRDRANMEQVVAELSRAVA